MFACLLQTAQELLLFVRREAMLFSSPLGLCYFVFIDVDNNKNDNKIKVGLERTQVTEATLNGRKVIIPSCKA